VLPGRRGGGRDAGAMRYIEAVERLVVDLRVDDAGELVRAGLRLVRLGWREAGAADRRADQVLLAVLAVDEVVGPYLAERRRRGGPMR
jgi:hypothetical protein